MVIFRSCFKSPEGNPRCTLRTSKDINICDGIQVYAVAVCVPNCLKNTCDYHLGI
jgi:hypothetical protein